MGKCARISGTFSTIGRDVVRDESACSHFNRLVAYELEVYLFASLNFRSFLEFRPDSHQVTSWYVVLTIRPFPFHSECVMYY